MKKALTFESDEILECVIEKAAKHSGLDPASLTATFVYYSQDDESRISVVVLSKVKGVCVEPNDEHKVLLQGPEPSIGIEATDTSGVQCDSETSQRRLSPTQYKILSLMSEGLSNKMIARRLARSDLTVKVHVKTILNVLNVRNRTEASCVYLKQKPAQASAQAPNSP